MDAGPAAGWVVVSGAAGSLGQVIAEHYARLGPVLALDKTSTEKGANENLHFCEADLRSPEEVEKALQRIPRSEPIKLLVNAVGMIWNEPALRMTGARLVAHDAGSFRETLEANVVAPFVVATKCAARMARTGGGAIVNFSSSSAKGVAGQAAYSAAKAAIEGMTRALAVEFGPLGIRVNAIAPGFFDVRSTRAALADDKIAQYVNQTASRRLGEVEELINSIVFLENNAFVNGIVLEIDGGLRI